jgi:hypothetical protein
MSGQVHSYPRRMPLLYRLGMGFRRASVLVLVLLILFVGSVVYSTSELGQSPPQVSSFSVGFGANSTMILVGSLTVSNPGFYPVQALTLSARVVNETGMFLGNFALGPTDLAGQATNEYPLEMYLPVVATGPGASLLVRDQFVTIALWGNATFGYLFPAGITLFQNRSWGAPFANLAYRVGSASPNGTVPVSVSFQNQASLTEAGVLRVSVVASTGILCGSVGWTLNVAPDQPFSGTQPLTLATGCSPVGGTLVGEYTTPDYSVPLPPEAVP